MNMEATELGTMRKAIGGRCGRSAVDTSDFDAMRAECHRIADTSTRELMMTSTDMLREVAIAAAMGMDTILLASELAMLSDANANPTAINEALMRLLDFVRAIIKEKSPC
jgi:ABC-type phosphate/phosphonate transport system permease subunit